MKYNVWRQELSRLQNVIQEFDEDLSHYDGDDNLKNYWKQRKPLTDALEAWYQLESTTE